MNTSSPKNSPYRQPPPQTRLVLAALLCLAVLTVYIFAAGYYLLPLFKAVFEAPGLAVLAGLILFHLASVLAGLYALYGRYHSISHLKSARFFRAGSYAGLFMAIFAVTIREGSTLSVYEYLFLAACSGLFVLKNRLGLYEPAL